MIPSFTLRSITYFNLTLWLLLSGIRLFFCKMVSLSGAPARTLPAKWRRYPGARLEHYLKMASLSGCPALHICPLFKNRKKNWFSYDIYGFGINRIYKKTLQYVYLGFLVRVKVVEKLFFIGENKAVASESRKKKTVCNGGGVVAAKRSFWDVLLDLVGIYFHIFEFRSILSDVLDVGNVLFERSPETAISRGAAAGALVAIL